VIDSNNEAIAVKEARKLGIPVVAVVDTNCDPTVVDYVIPGNDDALRAIRLFASKIADSAVEGVQMATDKQYVEVAGVSTDEQVDEKPEAGEVEGIQAGALESPEEEVDLEAALGGGIRKSPATVSALDDAEAAESSF
jgi:small subunit ribosomal protein S2